MDKNPPLGGFLAKLSVSQTKRSVSGSALWRLGSTRRYLQLCKYFFDLEGHYEEVACEGAMHHMLWVFMPVQLL